MRKLNISHKALMIFEASYIYCTRHHLKYETFIDDVYMTENFDSSDNSEFNKIGKDLRSYRHSPSYKLTEITDQEYETCIDYFGEK